MCVFARICRAVDLLSLDTNVPQILQISCKCWIFTNGEYFPRPVPAAKVTKERERDSGRKKKIAPYRSRMIFVSESAELIKWFSTQEKERKPEKQNNFSLGEIQYFLFSFIFFYGHNNVLWSNENYIENVAKKGRKRTKVREIEKEKENGNRKKNER